MLFVARVDGLVVRFLACESVVAGERMMVAIKRAVIRFKMVFLLWPTAGSIVAEAKYSSHC